MRARLIFEILCVNMLFAISGSQVSAACLNPPMSPPAISQFRSAPLDLVAPNSDTRAVEATTRDLAGTDASLAADLVRIAREADPRYQTAIAAGLALAAITCSTVDQQAAQLIQEAVASYADGQFQASFAAVSGDLSTAATFAAIGSASSSTGSVQVTNSNQSTGPGIAPVSSGGTAALILLATPGQSVTTSGFVTANSASTSTANSVSPTQ
jgi:hypothetical protein